MLYVNYAMLGALGLIAVLFIAVGLSLLYHWGYFGISRSMRSILFIFFVAGGVTLFAAAAMIMFQVNNLII